MNTFKYIDILYDLAYSYNRSYHRTIKSTPLEWSKTRGLRTHLHEKENKIKDNSGIKVNDYVRVSRTEERFRKGYESGWTTEVFKVHNIRPFIRDSLKLYYLEDLDGEKIKGGFYKQEIQKVRFNPVTHEYKIEKILATRGKGKNKQLLVKWRGCLLY